MRPPENSPIVSYTLTQLFPNLPALVPRAINPLKSPVFTNLVENGCAGHLDVTALSEKCLVRKASASSFRFTDFPPTEGALVNATAFERSR